MKFYETALVATYTQSIYPAKMLQHNKPKTRKTTIEGRIQRITIYTIILPGFRNSTFFIFLR